MSDTIALRAEDFDMPLDSKISQVFSRLMKENSSLEENSRLDLYNETYSVSYSKYSVGMF